MRVWKKEERESREALDEDRMNEQMERERKNDKPRERERERLGETPRRGRRVSC